MLFYIIAKTTSVIYYANGEINYKVLNAVCRGYVVEKNVYNYFKMKMT